MVPCKDGCIEQRSISVYHYVIQNVALLYGLCLYTAVIYRGNMHGRDAIRSCIFIVSIYYFYFYFDKQPMQQNAESM